MRNYTSIFFDGDGYSVWKFQKETIMYAAKKLLHLVNGEELQSLIIVEIDNVRDDLVIQKVGIYT